ncbi:MAG TPA: EAL domain-containing protein [Verrucomicrobiae bacterium]|jgi:diguanylate cyclase (GGDEF)-like protein|nr:EAL domain-containing protein [Verrucomicrobiae bacterium]
MKIEPRECVLLIHCNPADVRLISKALIASPHRILEVESVNKLADALERIGQGGVRAVIMDIEMPEGFASFEKLLSSAPHVPILILSGTETECIARQAVEQGAQDYLLKNQLEKFRLGRVVRSMIELKAKEEAAIQQQQCADVILSCTGDAVLISDAARFVRHLNEPAELLTGWSCQEAVGRSLDEVFQTIDTISRQAVGDPLATASVDKKNVPLCSNCVLVQRHGFEVAIEGSAAYTRDRVGNINGSIFVFNDISAARAKSLELSHLAQHDFLTDLPNRVLLNDRITQAISFAARYSKQLAVMFLDLDGFKSINDSLGHTSGDKLLQLVASRLVACVRRSDTVSRLGGDEFVVLLYQVEHAEDAAFISKKILSSLAEPFFVEHKHLDISASIGVSTYPGDGQDAETLLQKADTAMYAAKKLGRNNCQFFRAEMQARLLERQRLEGSLRHALSRDEFTLHYQPKISLKTGEITGVEALLRWKHPTRGLVSPLQFVPIAEETGLIVPIGQWVLLQACRQSRAWMDAGLAPVRMAVNVSAAEFMAKDFLSGVRAALISTGVDPHNLELELTETVLMRDAESAVRILHALKAIGVQLAVDDFGIGYSSFSYLQRFPLDALKIDRTFINEISAAGEGATILSAMIDIGLSLKHRVIAEGVETAEQLHFLQKKGCSEGQGYLFCHPIIAEKFAEFLESGARESVVH